MNYQQAKRLKKNSEVEVKSTGKKYQVIKIEVTGNWVTVITTGGTFFHQELF